MAKRTVSALEPETGPEDMSVYSMIPWIVGIILVALALRTTGCSDGLRSRELHTSWVVGQGFGTAKHRASIDSHPPLYYLLVRGVTGGFGHHEQTLRLPSLAAGMTLIPVVFAIACRLGCHRRNALLAASLIAIDTQCVRASTDAQPYAVIQLACSLQILGTWMFLRQPSPLRFAWWFVLSAALPFLSSFASLLLVAEVAFFLAALAVEPNWSQQRRRRTYLMCFTCAVTCLPGVLLLGRLGAQTKEWLEFVVHPPVTSIFTMLPLHTYGLAPAILVAILPRRRAVMAARIEEHKPVFLFLICLLFGPILAVWTANQLNIGHLFSPSNLLFVLIPMALLAATLGSLLTETSTQRIFIAVLILVAAFTISPLRMLGQDFPARVHQQEGWREAVGFLRRRAEAQGSVILLHTDFVQSDAWYRSADDDRRAYCTSPLFGAYRLEKDPYVIPLPRTKPFELEPYQLAILGLADSIWVVFQGPSAELTPTLDSLAAAAEAKSGRLVFKSIRQFGLVKLLQVEFSAKRVQPSSEEAEPDAPTQETVAPHG